MGNGNAEPSARKSNAYDTCDTHHTIHRGGRTQDTAILQNTAERNSWGELTRRAKAWYCCKHKNMRFSRKRFAEMCKESAHQSRGPWLQPWNRTYSPFMASPPPLLYAKGIFHAVRTPSISSTSGTIGTVAFRGRLADCAKKARQESGGAKGAGDLLLHLLLIVVCLRTTIAFLLELIMWLIGTTVRTEAHN